MKPELQPEPQEDVLGKNFVQLPDDKELVRLIGVWNRERDSQARARGYDVTHPFKFQRDIFIPKIRERASGKSPENNNISDHEVDIFLEWYHNRNLFKNKNENKGEGADQTA